MENNKDYDGVLAHECIICRELCDCEDCDFCIGCSKCIGETKTQRLIDLGADPFDVQPE
jgi:hypothetical protein